VPAAGLAAKPVCRTSSLGREVKERAVSGASAAAAFKDVGGAARSCCATLITLGHAPFNLQER